MWAKIPGFIEEIEARPDTKVVILHGGNTGAFAAGADISEFETTYATPEGAALSEKKVEAALSALENCEKPVLAAIEGACVGGGVSLATCVDIRIAADTAKFGITPAKLGLVYPASHTRRLLQTVGPSRAKELMFTGRIFSAKDAERMNLVDRLTEEGGALSAARELASEISDVSQWSNRATKKMIKGLQSDWTETGDAARALMREGTTNADFKEGVRAFLEKRKPNFTL